MSNNSEYKHNEYPSKIKGLLKLGYNDNITEEILNNIYIKNNIYNDLDISLSLLYNNIEDSTINIYITKIIDIQKKYFKKNTNRYRRLLRCINKFFMEKKNTIYI